MLREYKRKIELAVLDVTTEEIKPLVIITMEEPTEYLTIPLQKNSLEENQENNKNSELDEEMYMQHKRNRNKRVFAKFGKEYEITK